MRHEGASGDAIHVLFLDVGAGYTAVFGMLKFIKLDAYDKWACAHGYYASFKSWVFFNPRAMRWRLEDRGRT